MSEDTRRRFTLVLAYGSWLGAFGLTAVLTYFNVTRPATLAPTTYQRVGGLFIILLMGIGIAAGNALSRMRLAKTIARVFEAGYAFNRDRYSR